MILKILFMLLQVIYQHMGNKGNGLNCLYFNTSSFLNQKSHIMCVFYKLTWR